MHRQKVKEDTQYRQLWDRYRRLKAIERKRKFRRENPQIEKARRQKEKERLQFRLKIDPEFQHKYRTRIKYRNSLKSIKRESSDMTPIKNKNQIDQQCVQNLNPNYWNIHQNFQQSLQNYKLKKNQYQAIQPIQLPRESSAINQELQINLGAFLKEEEIDQIKNKIKSDKKQINNETGQLDNLTNISSGQIQMSQPENKIIPQVPFESRVKSENDDQIGQLNEMDNSYQNLLDQMKLQ